MKERFIEGFRNYFIIATLINAAMFILGMIFAPDMRFGYEAYVYPLIYAFIGSIPNLIMPKKKEMTVRQTLIRESFSMILIIILIIAFMFLGKPATTETIIIASGVALSVIIVFISVNVITWIIDSKTAQNMTADLKAFQEVHNAKIVDVVKGGD